MLKSEYHNWRGLLKMKVIFYSVTVQWKISFIYNTYTKTPPELLMFYGELSELGCTRCICKLELCATENSCSRFCLLLKASGNKGEQWVGTRQPFRRARNIESKYYTHFFLTAFTPHLSPIQTQHSEPNQWFLPGGARLYTVQGMMCSHLCDKTMHGKLAACDLYAHLLSLMATRPRFVPIAPLKPKCGSQTPIPSSPGSLDIAELLCCPVLSASGKQLITLADH